MRISAFMREEDGTSAAEFALVLIPFITLIFGIIGVSLMLYANHSLKYAAEEAARCASVKVATCTNPATIQAYAASHYQGPLISPSFTYNASASCGHQVIGTANFPLNAGLVNLTVPLQGKACFP